jgi:3-methylcrotonyl-CoA carboxylase alpha subunit
MHFNRILIANRGEIAVRIMRACRELGIATVAIYSDADRGAMHVRHANEAYPVGPAPATASYLNVARIIEVARRSGAQAIHPGYGFLSERAHFARACQDAGIVFIGPPPEAIELLGSKIAAKRLAAEAGVPTAPGYMGDDQRLERLLAEAERIGFPLLIKASAGGGGKGMRTVQRLDELASALEGAQREAQAAFGDAAVFLEKLILRPRHIEIQVLADTHGNAVSLFERECSIQRRHQKIIEESPSAALTPALRAEMGAAAVRLALAAGYVNAGTVEFVVGTDSNGVLQPYFLEVNTRLQVEHPVTELVTGLDLVKLQIAVAAGEPLPFRQSDLEQRGHAIEVRIYAEDPATYLPSTGRVALFAPAEGPGVRNDVGLESGDEVTVNYDPMLAKLIVSAPDRPAAIDRLGRALDEYAVLGVTTNLPLLRAIAEHPVFAAGATFTDFLATTGLSSASFEPDTVPSEVLMAAAIVDGDRARGLHTAAVTDPWVAGAWRHLGEGLRLHYTAAHVDHTVILARKDDSWRATVGDQTLAAETVAHQAGALTLRIADVTLPASDSPVIRTERFHLASQAAERLVAWRGQTYTLARAGALSLETLGGQSSGTHGHAGLEAPMPGTIVKVLVQEGQQVDAHQPLVVLEAMKMEHIVAAPYDGTVERIFFAPGVLVAKGATLIELDER